MAGFAQPIGLGGYAFTFAGVVTVRLRGTSTFALQLDSHHPPLEVTKWRRASDTEPTCSFVRGCSFKGSTDGTIAHHASQVSGDAGGSDMTRGTSTTTECVSAWSDLMDAGSKDCASATSVVQTIPPMNQSGSSARFMRDDYSHRQVGVVGLVWLESVGDVQLHPEGTAEPGALEAAAHANSQNLGIGPVRRHGHQRGCALTPPSHLLPGRGTLYGGRAWREPLSLNAGDPIVTLLALVSSSAHNKRHGVCIARAISCAMTGHGAAASENQHRFLPLHPTECPLWVISGHTDKSAPCPLYPQ